MKCKNCDFEGNFKFCPNCGTKCIINTDDEIRLLHAEIDRLKAIIKYPQENKTVIMSSKKGRRHRRQEDINKIVECYKKNPKRSISSCSFDILGYSDGTTCKMVRQALNDEGIEYKFKRKKRKKQKMGNIRTNPFLVFRNLHFKDMKQKFPYLNRRELELKISKLWFEEGKKNKEQYMIRKKPQPTFGNYDEFCTKKIFRETINNEPVGAIKVVEQEMWIDGNLFKRICDVLKQQKKVDYTNVNDLVKETEWNYDILSKCITHSRDILNQTYPQYSLRITQDHELLVV